MPHFLFTDGETEVKSLGHGSWTHIMVSGLPAGVCPFCPLGPPPHRPLRGSFQAGMWLDLCLTLSGSHLTASRGAKWDTAVSGRRKERGENRSSDGLALVGGANISDTQVFPILSPPGWAKALGREQGLSQAREGRCGQGHPGKPLSLPL